MKEEITINRKNKWEEITISFMTTWKEITKILGEIRNYP